MTDPTTRVRVAWTQEAIACMKKLPPKVRRGLFDKVGQLANCDDPEQVHKPLTGTLAGYFRVPYARYRAVYRVEREDLPNGDALLTVTVVVIAAGKREERSRQDIYRVAQKLVNLGIVDIKPEQSEDN